MKFYFIDAEFAVTRNNLYETIPTLYKQWFLSLDIMPTGLVAGWSNILHMGLGGNEEAYGDRTPGIWFTDMNTRLHIPSAINNDRNYNFYGNTDPIPMNEWTRVEVSQLRQSDDSYLFTIRIAGTVFTQIVNENPAEFSDVTVYTSDSFYKRSKAKINNLKIETFPDDSTTGEQI